jgi:hypothetical protein
MSYDVHYNGETSVHSHLENCPLCGQTLPNDDAARHLHAKLDAEQRARERQWEADKIQIAAASRNEGRAEAEAATQQRFTILLKENAQLKQDMQTTVDEQVNKLVADREAKFDVERALHSQEVTKLKAEVAKFARIGDQRSSQRLGEMWDWAVCVLLPASRRSRSRSEAAAIQVSCVIFSFRWTGVDQGRLVQQAGRFATSTSSAGNIRPANRSRSSKRTPMPPTGLRATRRAGSSPARRRRAASRARSDLRAVGMGPAAR